MDRERKPAEVLIWGAHRVGEGKYVFDLNTPVAANWLRAEGNRDLFAKGLAEGARVILRTYPIILKYVPVTFDTDNDYDLQEIGRKARREPNEVIGARWIKDPSRRSQNQKFAFLIADMRSPEAANAIIKQGAYLHGKRCDAKKYKTDPHRCNKCQRFGHVTAICRSEQPTCGHCAAEHWTSQCNIDGRKPFCSNCKKTNHGARDIECLAFDNRVKLQDNRNPDRKLTYYPTTEEWTHQLTPEHANLQLITRGDGRSSHQRESSL